ncbi:thymidine phosphorylase [Candidatus Pacearchaeota archaeon]|nr:thymidine phosphorylase [Candidatus Pacearchaeota archaeon]
MNLKVKFLKLSAGRPVAIMHKNTAEKSGIHVDDRISIRKKSRKIIAVVDIAVGMFEKDKIAVSTEISKELGLKENDIVEVEPASRPESISIISKKLKCKRLDEKEIKDIIQDIVENALTESEIAYFVSAIYKCGMTAREVRGLTEAIVETGKKLSLNRKIIVDKHSVGGIPGRTTPIVVSICAAAGLIMPKTSSRAITTPAGTADALETICKVDFTISEIKKIIKKTGACIVWGGSLGLAPADDKIIQVERLINLDPDEQLLASIMAKKLAMGSKLLLIEIPYGKYAKVNKKEAKKLEIKFKSLAKSFNIKVKCFIVKTSEPLGNGIGPALEIKDVISVLKRETKNSLLESRSLELSAEILEMAGKCKKRQGIFMARKILESGTAFKKFKQIINAQQGKIKNIPEAKYSHDIISTKSFKIKIIDIKKINSLARILGCPTDKMAGIYLHKHLHDKVKKREKLLTLFAESKEILNSGINFYHKNIPIK